VLDFSVVIGGAAGEGVQTLGEILARTVLGHGYPVFATQEYESRIRGGVNSVRLRVTDVPVEAPRHRADVLLTLNEAARDHYVPLLAESAVLVTAAGEGDLVLPFGRIAREEFDNPLLANSIAAGALVALLGIPLDTLSRVLRERFSEKDPGIVEANLRAAGAGFSLIEQVENAPWRGRISAQLAIPRQDRAHTFITAHEAIPLAAVAAGCRFIAAYPMSPSTGIITTLAIDATLGVFAEQAEDEIAAINMALGASYAGARAMTATSGGGFALMTEGLSLAGMTETPIVILLAQRPGPATGLPTRTAQEDLLFAIHAGHGEFPRLVLAPSDPLDAFQQTLRAFDLADTFQIPVLLLTDQFLADSRFSYERFDVRAARGSERFARPGGGEAYARYRFTERGVSPRLYPGQSPHLVCADSDEHDETGHITEDLVGTRPKMVAKRARKRQALQAAAPAPEVFRLDDADTVVVGWGSTRGAIREAIVQLREAGARVGAMHFHEVWPLPQRSFRRGKRVIVVEGNDTGQFATLLRGTWGIGIDNVISRSDGLPIEAEDIRRAIDE